MWITGFLSIILFYCHFNFQGLRNKKDLHSREHFVVFADRQQPLNIKPFDSFHQLSVYKSRPPSFPLTGFWFTTITATALISTLPTSAASPEVLSVSDWGPPGTESWCCETEECPHSSALCLLRGLRSLALSSSTWLCGSETKPA